MTYWLWTTVAYIAAVTGGYILGRFHERQARRDAHGGVITDKLPYDWQWPARPWPPHDDAALAQLADAMDQVAGVKK